MAKAVGSPFWLLVVWLVIAAMTLCGAFCFGELASRYPESGGLYVYFREAYGGRTAFLYGWMSLLVMDPGVTAAMAAGGATYAAYLFGWNSLTTKLAAVGALIALGVIHVLNTRLGAGVMRVVTWLKFCVLGLIVARAILFGLGRWQHFHPFVQQHAGSMPLLPALATAMVAAYYTYGGWWDVSKIAGEIEDPARTLPRAFVGGVLIVTAAYVLISGVFLYLVPLEQVNSDQGFVSQAGEVLFGGAGARILTSAVVLCVLGSLAVLTMVAPRVYFAMAQDGLFFTKVALPDPRFGTPSRAIAIQIGMASLLVLWGSFNQIISYFIFVAIAFIGIAISTIFVIRRRQPQAGNFILAPGYPYTPLFYLVVVAMLLVLMLIHSWLQPLVGVAVVLAGWPVYSLLERKHAREIAAVKGIA